MTDISPLALPVCLSAVWFIYTVFNRWLDHLYTKKQQDLDYLRQKN